MMAISVSYSLPADFNVYSSSPENPVEIRDYFAGLAMQALITQRYSGDSILDTSFEKVANEAYRMADTMIRCRLL